MHGMKTEFWMTSKKNVFMWFWAPFSQINTRWTPFLLVFLGSLPRFSGILWRFSQILPRFPLILPGFSTNQNFWVCACSPASYTTVCLRLFHDASDFNSDFCLLRLASKVRKLAILAIILVKVTPKNRRKYPTFNDSRMWPKLVHPNSK